MIGKPGSKNQGLAKALWLAVFCVLLTIDVTAQTAVAREAFKGSAEFREAVEETASSVKKYANQLEKTDRSLARLARSNGTLGERYKTFAGDLRKLEKAEKNAASNIEKLRARETEYLTAWDKANGQIADPELRRSLAIKRSEAMAQYRELADDVSAIGRDLQPIMSHLRDLDLFLGSDPSRASLTEASAMIDGSRAEIRLLRNEIAGVQRMLRDF